VELAALGKVFSSNLFGEADSVISFWTLTWFSTALTQPGKMKLIEFLIQ
jgi:hypothetical protein